MAENEVKFNTSSELFNRCLPAIHAKLDELRREKITNINEIDIWNSCIKNKWIGRNDLRLYEVIDDILNLDILDIDKYKNKTTDRNDTSER